MRSETGFHLQNLVHTLPTETGPSESLRRWRSNTFRAAGGLALRRNLSFSFRVEMAWDIQIAPRLLPGQGTPPE